MDKYTEQLHAVSVSDDIAEVGGVYALGAAGDGPGMTVPGARSLAI